jgi:hypothetical protein
VALFAGGLLAVLAVTATAMRGGNSDGLPAQAGMAARVVATQLQCEAYTETPANRTNGVSDETCLARAAYTVMRDADDPATLLPKIDIYVRSRSGLLASMCHLVMHRVGRLYANDHDVTLTNLLDFLPRSNSPNCSAGFAHGMISTLGPAVAAAGPQAAAICRGGVTREQEYTCIHGLGHAFMRNYSESIRDALRGCDSLGRRFAPDCGMGVFHDYWLSLSGLDETERPEDIERSPRTLCAAQPTRFVRVCWYPAFLIRPPSPPIGDPADVDRLCSGLRGIQRFGCVTAGSVVNSGLPAGDLATCHYFHGADAAACVRAVGAETLANKPVAAQVRLVDACSGFDRMGERTACFAWLARVLTVATDGHFAIQGCARVVPTGRQACRTGARAWRQPLETFT